MLYLVLGWSFLLAEFVGGALMIALLAIFTRVIFSSRQVDALRSRVGDNEAAAPAPTSDRRVTRDSVVRAARYTIGDLAYSRRACRRLRPRRLSQCSRARVMVESHLPEWSRCVDRPRRCSGSAIRRGPRVCSVGNIPLAATLGAHGVAFGGVVAFIFADLLALPLLAIDRRFYGISSTWPFLFALLWGAR